MATLSAGSFAAGLNQMFPRADFLIAYSGGLDSSVLLHLCALGSNAENKKRFLAVHVNHGLHPQSGDWVRHCLATCAGFGLACRVLALEQVAVPGRSLEEAARAARYRALRELTKAGTVVLTAQHRDDQAETILLQLLRGSGLEGLCGIPESVVFEPGILHRPLLGFSRHCIRSYAEAQGLHWIDDPSNADVTHDRNYLRHAIIPRMKARWPGMGKTLARSGTHCAEAQTILAAEAESWLRAVLVPNRQTISIARLSGFDEARQRLILRRWIRLSGFRMPSTLKMRELIREAVGAAPDRFPRIQWGNAEIRRYRGELYLLEALRDFDHGRVITWPIRSPLAIPDLGGILQCRFAKTADGRAGLPAETVRVRFRTGGETCRFRGRKGTRSLKKIFQELAVPPWERDRIPLVYAGEELAAIGGLLVCEPFQELGLECHWSRQSTRE